MLIYGKRVDQKAKAHKDAETLDKPWQVRPHSASLPVCWFLFIQENGSVISLVARALDTKSLLVVIDL